MGRDRDEMGQYSEKAPSEAVLNVLRQASDPVLTAKEVAEKLETSSETARRKLNELHEQGKIRRKEVGARAVVWWASESDY